MDILFTQKDYRLLPILGFRIVVLALVTSLSLSPSIGYAQPTPVLGLPEPGTMVNLSPSHVPVLIKGLKIHPENPLAIDFIVDTGNSGLKINRAEDKQTLSQEAQKVIKYFLAGLTLPADKVWVNLSPYERSRIIPKDLGQTLLGRDMLAEDYILKQITASLIYPEKEVGREFWHKVYAQAQERFGTTQVPINTFNKVWIVADKATVFENKDVALVVKAHLKVMLEEDYLSLSKHSGIASSPSSPRNDTHALSSQIVRSIVLPALEKEVNQGHNFANLRQIFHSLILAKWYKEALAQALINQVYSNQNKVSGVDVRDKTIVSKIYQQYLRAYKKGVFNFIKEDIDQTTQQPLPRKYFSGGVLGDMDLTVTRQAQDVTQAMLATGAFVLVKEAMHPVKSLDAAMAVWEESELEELSLGSAGTDKYKPALLDAIDFLDKDKFKNVTIKIVKIPKPKPEFLSWFSEKNNVIYISERKVQELEELQQMLLEKYGQDGDLGIWTREFIYALAGGSITDRREQEFAYALKKFPRLVVARFPSKEALPQKILKRIENTLIRIWKTEGNQEDEEKVQVDLKSIEALRKTLDLNEGVAISPVIDSQTRRFYEAVLESAKDSLYKIAINALNGTINLRQRIRLSEQDPELTGNEEIAVEMFAFGANPPTVADTIIGMLKTMADNELDTSFATVTKGDFREPGLKATFDIRQAVAEELINYLFAGLIRVAPPLKDDPGLNGEEKVLKFFKLNRKAKNISISYAARKGRYQSLVHKNSQLVFTEITHANWKDFEYYVRLPGYAQLLKKYYEQMADSIPHEYVDFFRKLMQSPDPMGLMRLGARFPTLETVGKLYLIQDAINRDEYKAKEGLPIGTHIQLVKIGIGEDSNGHDRLRRLISQEVVIDGEKIGVEPLSNNPLSVLTNSGIPYEVSSTSLRNAAIELVRQNRFDVNDFIGMHLPVLQMAMNPWDGGGSQLFGTWARSGTGAQEEISQMDRYPRRFEALVPMLRDSKASRMRSELARRIKIGLDTMRARVKQILDSEFKDINTSYYQDQDRTIVKVEGRRRGGGNVIKLASFSQYWVAFFDSEGRPISQQVFEDHMPQKNGGAKRHSLLREAVETFFKDLNNIDDTKSRSGAVVVVKSERPSEHRNSAMVSSYGGIDFNANRMQLNVQKQGAGVGMHFDPAMVQQFKNGDFQGFVPVIINISPIQDIALVLGLNKSFSIGP